MIEKTYSNYSNKKAPPEILWLLVLLLAGLLSGCSKDLDYELPYVGEKLVLNGTLSPDSVVSLRVSKTMPVSGDFRSNLRLTDAQVAFFEDGVYLENLVHTTHGTYRSSSGFKPIPGKAYHVQVSAPGLASAETLPEQVPFPPQIGHYAFHEEIKSVLNNVPTRKLTMEILDEGSTTDFYNIDVRQYYKGASITAPAFYSDKLLEVGDPCGFLGNGNEFNLSDSCFNGNGYTVNIGVELRGSVIINNQFLQVDAQQVVVRLRNISSNYYKHLKSSYQPEGIELAFSGQNILYSNVKGGFGMLAAYNEQKIIINL